MGRLIERARALWRLGQQEVSPAELWQLGKRLLTTLGSLPYAGRLLTAGWVTNWVATIALLRVFSDGWSAFFLTSSSAIINAALWEGQRRVGRRAAQVDCEAELATARLELNAMTNHARHLSAEYQTLRNERDQLRLRMGQLEKYLESTQQSLASARCVFNQLPFTV